MDLGEEQILNEPFFLFEKESVSRKVSGYNVYTRCAFRTWGTLDDTRKMSFIWVALREVVINRMKAGNILPPDFNSETDDPFSLILFTSEDFKSDMRTVVNYHWSIAPQTKKDNWNIRASRINARPLIGQLNSDSIPERLTEAEENYRRRRGAPDPLLRQILQKDYNTVWTRFDNIFKRRENCDSTYNKVEHMYLDIEIYHKFYFSKQIPYSMFSSLFGNLSIFTEDERVSKKDSKSQTFHIATMERAQEIFSFCDVNLAEFWLYDNIEVDHKLCSYGFMKLVGETDNIKFYGWRKDREKLVVAYNNYDDTRRLEVIFDMPSWHKTVTGKDRNSREKFKYDYECIDSNLSTCCRFKLVYFCPLVIRINVSKVSLKVLASRACITVGESAFNKYYSS